MHTKKKKRKREKKKMNVCLSTHSAFAQHQAEYAYKKEKKEKEKKKMNVCLSTQHTRPAYSAQTYIHFLFFLF